MRRYGLTDEPWNTIKDKLPGKAGDVGVTAKDHRLFVESVLYRYKTGIPWRDLQKRFGNFRSVPLRYTRWSPTGVWETIFKGLSEDADTDTP